MSMENEITGPWSEKPAFEKTDMGNALRFCEIGRDKLAYCPDNGQWLVSKDGKWVRDELMAHVSHAIDVVRSIFEEAAERDDVKDLGEWAAISSNWPRIGGMIELAKALLAIDSDEFDRLQHRDDKS